MTDFYPTHITHAQEPPAVVYVGRVHEVEFKIEPEDLGMGVQDVVNILVDGIRLQELVREVEMPLAQAEGNPELAGDYAGLLADLGILWPSRHFLGEPVMAVDGRTYLLGCVCGWPDCGPLAAQIEVDPTTVLWSGWRGRWDLPNLGTFIFDRENYQDSLQRLARS